MNRVVTAMLASAAVACLAACEREQRHLARPSPMGESEAGAPATERVAYDVSQGKRLFGWYNCSGCHANGGGGMGPPLMDAQWRYGSTSAQIVESILHGRPNGMPAFSGRVPASQAWQIAAYVRSMSGQLRTDVAPNRSDRFSTGVPESRRDRAQPVASSPSGG
jgi:cytochrome c oxidase cbb3-type subunit 3